MKLYNFQLDCFNQANLSKNKKAQFCYRDCVNYSGSLAYEMNSKKEFNDEKCIETTIGYQLTRFEIPGEVREFMKERLKLLKELNKISKMFLKY